MGVARDWLAPDAPTAISVLETWGRINEVEARVLREAVRGQVWIRPQTRLADLARLVRLLLTPAANERPL